MVALPFTRQIADPVDFTPPGIFNLRDKVVKDTRPHTTLCKQLAEYVVLYSLWQMAADEIQNYEGQPGLTFIENVPTNWQRTVIAMAEIGKYIMTAREDRNSSNWFIVGMTDENARDITLKFNFLDASATYKATIYRDGVDADYGTAPYAMEIDRQTVDVSSQLRIHIARSGGFAIQLIKQ